MPQILSLHYLLIILLILSSHTCGLGLNGTTPEPETTCEDLRYQSPEDACRFVQVFCSSSVSGFFNYRIFYFCTTANWKPLGLVLLAAWLAFLFGFVGIAAADYFTPNLNTIASTLGMSESLTGVTFLAFGNGSPDLFATFTAMKASSSSLAVGELLGAAAFIVSVVGGSVALIKPLRVPRESFMRDVVFFSLAIVFLLLILADGRLEWWESCFLIVYYAVYVIVVAASTVWLQRKTSRQEQIDQARMEYEIDVASAVFDDENQGDLEYDEEDMLLPAAEENEESVINVNDSDVIGHSDLNNDHVVRATRALNLLETGFPRTKIRPSLLDAVEFQDVVQRLENESASTGLGNTNNVFMHPRSHSTTSLHFISVREPADGPFRHEFGRQRHHSAEETNLELTSSHFRNVSSLRTRDGLLRDPWIEHMIVLTDSPIESDHSGEVHSLDGENSPVFLSPSDYISVHALGSKASKVQDALRFLKQEIFPTFFPSVARLHGKSWLSTVISLCAVPAVFVLKCTLPVIHETRLEKESIFTEQASAKAPNNSSSGSGRHVLWQKWLLCVQTILSPLFIATALRSNSHAIILYGIALGIGAISSASIYRFASPYRVTRQHYWLSFVGFVVAIFWIYTVANEVVEVLLTLGQILGISEAILGVTIFAIGNSLADLVADVAVARMGYSVMAISACFGGPMLNILLGLGLGGTFMTLTTQENIVLEMSPTIFITAGTLSFVLIFTLVFAPLNKFKLDRKWGLVLIASYIVSMVANVLEELLVTR